MSGPVRRAVHLSISGRVQGVGYRDFLERQAKALALTGWVRNRRDGTVEAVLVGPSPAVETMVNACRRGPPAASVKDVKVADYTGPLPDGFTMLPTR
jgi:acylphosphatase